MVCNGYLAGDYFLVVLMVFLQKIGDGQAVWTAADALAAVYAVFNFCHFLLPMFAEILLMGRAADKLHHSGCLSDINILGAGHAVAAAAAKSALQLLERSAP